MSSQCLSERCCGRQGIQLRRRSDSSMIRSRLVRFHRPIRATAPLKSSGNRASKFFHSPVRG
jgi:hypothetical protein